MTDIVLRRLGPGDVAGYRRLRLLGLRESSSAFGSSYAEERRRPTTDFLRRLQPSPGNWTFAAFRGSRMVGVVSFVRQERRKQQHKAAIYGFYIMKQYRGRRIGRLLLDEVLATARAMRGLRQVQLAVVESNGVAVRFYQSAGFRVYGREEAALRIGDKYYTELFMDLVLRPRGRTKRAI